MSIHEKIRSQSSQSVKRDTTQAAPLTLAYIGDTVYDLYVRTFLIDTADATPHALHLMSAKYVCAAGQAAAFRRIEPILTESELAVFKRGRNAHSGTMPKNASSADYHTATGLEALIGYLFLQGEDDRIAQLLHDAIEGE